MSVRYEEYILGALEGGFGEFPRVERKSVKGDLKSAKGRFKRGSGRRIYCFKS